MSADPKHIFSLMGLLLTANRIQLQPDIIRASMAVGSWDKEGIINIVDKAPAEGRNRTYTVGR